MIGFKPESRDELRERLREMSDLELRRFGLQARKFRRKPKSPRLPPFRGIADRHGGRDIKPVRELLSREPKI